MKKTILKFLVLALSIQMNAFQAHAQIAPGPTNERLSIETIQEMLRSPILTNEERAEVFEKIQTMLDSNILSEDERLYLTDLIESNGEILKYEDQAPVVLTDEEKEEESAVDEEIQNIGGNTTLALVQELAIKKVKSKGQWGFSFMYIDKAGKTWTMSGLNEHAPIRPASTMKVFSSYLTFNANLVAEEKNLKPIFPESSLQYLLQHSKNGMADASLRASAKNWKLVLAEDPNFDVNKMSDYIISNDSYLANQALVDYHMHDSTERQKPVIDLLILKGCSLMINAYRDLQDSSKFHPVNGSGLQDSWKDAEIHKNQVTPRLETALLQKIYRDPSRYSRFKRLLTSPGGGGTLGGRFAEGRAYGRIYAKTGTLGNGKALMGFAEIPNGGTMLFAILGDSLAMSTTSAMTSIIEPVVSSHMKFLNLRETPDGSNIQKIYYPKAKSKYKSKKSKSYAKSPRVKVSNSKSSSSKGVQVKKLKSRKH